MSSLDRTVLTPEKFVASHTRPLARTVPEWPIEHPDEPSPRPVAKPVDDDVSTEVLTIGAMAVGALVSSGFDSSSSDDDSFKSGGGGDFGGAGASGSWEDSGSSSVD